MRECVAAIIFYLSVKMIGSESAFLITIGLLASLASMLYIALSLIQRRLIGDRWFRSTPGRAQIPPFEDENAVNATDDNDDEQPPSY